MIDSLGDGKEIDVEMEMNALTIVIVARTLMGRDVTEIADEFGRLQRDFIRDTERARDNYQILISRSPECALRRQYSKCPLLRNLHMLSSPGWDADISHHS